MFSRKYLLTILVFCLVSVNSVFAGEQAGKPKGYSIPLIDLAGETHRQIIVDKEPGAIRSPNGKQIALLLRENSRKYNSFVIFSNDEGRSWTKPIELTGALIGDRHTGRYAPDGRLFITFRDTTHESPTKGDWIGWVGTYKDIVNGRQGQYRVRLMDNHKAADCAYPGLELLPDGTFVTTTYGHWIKGESPFIMSVRFKLEEIDAKAHSINSKEILR